MDQKTKLRRILYTVGLISGGGVLLLQLVKAIKSISLIEFSKDFVSSVVLAVFFCIYSYWTPNHWLALFNQCWRIKNQSDFSHKRILNFILT